MNHSTVDLINAAFESGGMILCWNNVRKLRRDREIKGVFWPAQIWWSLWGLWNVLYYGAVGHPWSQIAGAVLVAGNITWTVHAWLYSRQTYGRMHRRIRPWPFARGDVDQRERDLQAFWRGE